MKTQRNILIILLLASLLLTNFCSRQSVENFKDEHNIEALTDTLRTYKSKNGKLVFEKKSLITTKSELKKLNNELLKSVKNLKDNPIVITKVITTVTHDTIEVLVEKDIDNIKWSADSSSKRIKYDWVTDTTFTKDNFRYISGTLWVEVDTLLNTNVDNFKVETDSMGISFTTGITENSDDKIEIFITSDYPGFNATKIDGALIDPRDSEVIKKFFPKKRLGLGVYLGVGPSFTSDRGFTIEPQIGFGVTYDILQLPINKKRKTK